LTGNKRACLFAISKSGRGGNGGRAVRIPALAILTIATVLTAAPARAQRYDPAYPVCLHVYDWGPTITNADTRRCLSATRRHRAAPPIASSIHILLTRRSLRGNIIGGIAAFTKADNLTP
jgi:hypothetical protein